MRRFWVWCLLALLPWRLWAADAMALHPCGPGEHGAVLAHTSGHPSSHGHDQAPFAQPPHAHAAPAATETGAVGDDGQPAAHAGCTLCDLCHNTAWVSEPTPALGLPAPQFWATTHARVPPAPTPGPPLKPPIA